MKRILLFLTMAATVPFGSLAQGFEGSIYFTRSNQTDVIRYAYHVKGDKVRIDEFEETSDKVIGTMLVDLTKEELLALSHQRQLFMERQNRDSDMSVGGDVVVTPGSRKTIMGKPCQQMRVKNEKADREIAYWVAEGDYDFFPKLMKVLKRKDNFATYYMEIPEMEGKMPIHATERDLLRNQKGTLAVERIDSHELAAEMFEVPKDYYKVDQ